MPNYKNDYTADPALPDDLPFECHLNTPPEEYDLNFCGGPIYELRTDRVALIPFIPGLHAKQYAKELKGNAALMDYMPYPRRMDLSLDNQLYVIEARLRSQSSALMFAIFDLTVAEDGSETVPGPYPVPKGHPPLNSMAGVIALMNTTRVDLMTEIGHVLILPKAQRTHVSTHAIALLQHYALDHPYTAEWSTKENKFIYPEPNASNNNQPRPSLGMRRLQWQAHYKNIPSARAASRMGFRHEGIVREHRIVLEAEGSCPHEEGRANDGGIGGSRTSWVGSITWSQWEKETGEVVDALVAR